MLPFRSFSQLNSRPAMNRLAIRSRNSGSVNQLVIIAI